VQGGGAQAAGGQAVDAAKTAQGFPANGSALDPTKAGNRAKSLLASFQRRPRPWGRSPRGHH
jgi:hypothetical protein